MNWTDYVIKRVAFTIVTIFVAISLNFLLFRVLPGTAVTNLARVPNATVALKRHLRAEFGLNLPLWTQYWDYLKQLAHGNLGVSFANQQPVSSNLKSALYNTLPGRHDRDRALAHHRHRHRRALGLASRLDRPTSSARTPRSSCTRCRPSGSRSCC